MNAQKLQMRETAVLEQKNTFAAVDAYIARQMTHLNVPGAALAVVQDGRIVHMRGFGQARTGGETPTAQTPFWIGSLTKSVTALAVMQLVEAHKIELDAPAQRYLPWFRVADAQASAPITVRHLLHQTSGLPTSAGESRLADPDARPDATERQGRALQTTALAHEVGTTFEYSNANYNLLGLIIEAASGETYAHYVQTHIFDPLDMRHTYTSPAAAQQNGLALGHRYWFAAPQPAPNLPIPHGSLPAGLLISTAEDMAHYLIAHLNGGCYGNTQILSAAGIDELQRGVANFPMPGFGTRQYGMGWFVEQIGGAKLVWHSGTLPDFAAHMALLPEQKTGFVLLFNANHHMMVPVFIGLGMGVTALLAGLQPGPGPLHMDAWMPWALRGLLLIPALQITGVAWTRRLRGRRALLPLLANMLAGLLLLKPLLGKRRGYLRLYLPDYAWIAQVCGGFALLWGCLGTVLTRRRSGENPT